VVLALNTIFGQPNGKRGIISKAATLSDLAVYVLRCIVKLPESFSGTAIASFIILLPGWSPKIVSKYSGVVGCCETLFDAP
jgi:hypothetical protein